MDITKEEAVKRIKILLQHKKEMEERAINYLKNDYTKEFQQT